MEAFPLFLNILANVPPLPIKYYSLYFSGGS